ncbi:MAG: hypothetical protein QNL91_13860 [Candidatus Krumholzibacteria bacterium]|nr:hypothetical protein [Candidatus Krumholzibacteria bacterium]
MKRITVLLLALVMALGVVATPEASAGWFKKDKKPERTEKPDWMKKPQRYEGPRMSFHSGVLQQDGQTGWKLGETSIQFAKDCLITTDGAEGGYLDAGREAIVMGPKFGDTILAWSIRVTQPDYTSGRNQNGDVQLIVSETNPNCGEIVEAPQ